MHLGFFNKFISIKLVAYQEKKSISKDMMHCCVKLVACETIGSTHHIKMRLYYVPTCILLLGLTINMEFIAIFEHSVHMEPGSLIS